MSEHTIIRSATMPDYHYEIEHPDEDSSTAPQKWATQCEHDCLWCGARLSCLAAYAGALVCTDCYVANGRVEPVPLGTTDDVIIDDRMLPALPPLPRYSDSQPVRSRF